MSQAHHFVGLISGTSVDAIDAVILSVHGEEVDIIASHAVPYSAALRADILSLSQPGDNEIDRLGPIDRQIADHFASAALNIIQRANLTPEDISAIGSHGQTIRHRPNSDQPFTLQIGDPNRIAELTGITTVADFRRRDMAAGGQGAPLVPAFHRAAFRLDQSSGVVNIGGIANVTLCDKQGALRGFDSGPGNTLMDYWTAQHTPQSYDNNGDWARTGAIDDTVLQHLLADPYFASADPKSTGPEYFSPTWLMTQLKGFEARPPATIQRTLLELTARSIAAVTIDEPLTQLAVCGGGAHNGLLMERLSALLTPINITTTDAYGIHPDWVEAAAFGWLAHRTMNNLAGNEPSATGAEGYRVLGAIYPAYPAYPA